MVCVVTKDIDEAEDVEISAQAIGYVRKNRRILDGLGFVMIIMEVPPGYSVRQGIAELRTKFPALVIDANHRYSLNSAAHHDTRIYARRLIGWDPVTPRCGAEIRLGLVDTRVDLTHPVLKRQNIKNRSFLPQEATAAPADHGTSIAALLVGKPMNETAGLLPESSLFVAEIFREREARRFETTTWLIVRALDWLVRKNVHVINLSFGGSQNSLLAFAVRRTLDNNISLVAAAGHHSPLGGPSYPAAQEGVVAVTALDADRRPYRRAASGPYISLSAPGVDIWVPDADGMGRYVSGTSFAAPFVTAVIASFKRVHPHWTPEQIRQAIERSALDLGNPGWDPIFGWGLVQAPIACQR